MSVRLLHENCKLLFKRLHHFTTTKAGEFRLTQILGNTLCNLSVILTILAGVKWHFIVV